MWLSELFTRCLSRPATGSKVRRSTRLAVEHLEERTLLANYIVSDVTSLITAINSANQAPSATTITLKAGKTFTLTDYDNTTDGATGLPIITAKNLTIVGNGDTIARNSGAALFRLLDVASGASLTLQNLTLQGGYAYGSWVQAEGGAIYNQGVLDLNGVTVQSNMAQGSTGQSAEGGGIYSNGTLTLEGGSIVQSNVANGGEGSYQSKGGAGLGGGVYVAGGTASLTNITLSGNTAQGGRGGTGQQPGPMGNMRQAGTGGDGLGGGLYVASGSITLSNDSVTDDHAKAGADGDGRGNPLGKPAIGKGGGLYIDPAASYVIDAYTLSHFNKNKASTSDADAYGINS